MFVENLLFFLWFSILLVNGLPQNDSIYSKSCEVIEKETGDKVWVKKGPTFKNWLLVKNSHFCPIFMKLGENDNLIW